MNELSFAQRVAVLVGVLIVAVGGLLFVEPIPQDPAYHRFADTQSHLGLANFGNVTSNLGFAIVGVLGLAAIFARKDRDIFEQTLDAWPYIVFFFGILLVGAGLLGNTISGHGLKHLLSAVATYMILRMLVQSKTRSP